MNWTAWAIDEHGNARQYTVWGKTRAEAESIATKKLMPTETLHRLCCKREGPPRRWPLNASHRRTY